MAARSRFSRSSFSRSRISRSSPSRSTSLSLVFLPCAGVQPQTAMHNTSPVVKSNRAHPDLMGLLLLDAALNLNVDDCLGCGTACQGQLGIGRGLGNSG